MIVAATGHRPKRLFKIHEAKQLMPAVRAMSEWLLVLAGGEPITGVSGFADGFDWIFACAVLALGRQGYPAALVASLPWPGFEDKPRDRTAREWAAKALARCCHIHAARTRKPEGSGPVNAALWDRNVWMVEQAIAEVPTFAVDDPYAADHGFAVLAACFDGDEGVRSGTLNTMRHAERRGLAVTPCWDVVAHALAAQAA